MQILIKKKTYLTMKAIKDAINDVSSIEHVQLKAKYVVAHRQSIWRQSFFYFSLRLLCRYLPGCCWNL